MAEGLGRTPREDVPRQLDEEFLGTIGQEFSASEGFDNEIKVLQHRRSELKRLRSEIEASKGEAVTYLESLSLENEAIKVQDLVTLDAQAEKIVERAESMLESEYQILNPQLLESSEDARAGLKHLTAERLRNANDELLISFNDLQEMATDMKKYAEQYHQRAIEKSHTKR